MNHQATALIGLLTETSLHAGAGGSVSGTDLPIQREAHNGWPCVFGSGVKGALRDRAESHYGRGSNEVLALFGPETANAADNAGAIAIGDARLLLLPVRSLTGTFKWVTCFEALQRLQRDARRTGVESIDYKTPNVDSNEEALAIEGGDELFLEEYRFSLNYNKTEHIKKCIADVAKLMKRNGGEDSVLEELRKRFVIVSDDMFTYLTQAAVPVNAHIALNADTKTVRDGALWYEETLPPETLLYTPVVTNRSRKKEVDLEAEDVRKTLTDMFSKQHWLQLGGNETVGMGWCSVSVLEG